MREAVNGLTDSRNGVNYRLWHSHLPDLKPLEQREFEPSLSLSLSH